MAFERASDITALVAAAYSPVLDYEVHGGDAVGTDAYPALRDAHPDLVAALASPAAELRMAAAHALSLIIDRPFPTLPTAELPLERAAMILAAGRHRGSEALRTGAQAAFPFDGIALPDGAAEAAPIERAALVIAELWSHAEWGRRVQPAVAEALVIDPVEVGPWGGGDLAALCRAMRANTVLLSPSSITYRGGPDEDTDETDEADEEDAEDLDDETDDADDADQIGDQPVPDPYMQSRPERAAPRIALPGLHDVDWAHLEHAYGVAHSVPHAIDALTSPDPADREWGIETLSASINHQGSVYSASGPAVPFLVALATNPAVSDRAPIVRLLAGLAVGDPRWHLTRDLDDAQSTAWPAVAAHADALLALLDEPDARLREATALTLAFLAPTEGMITKVKRALALERDRYVRASLLVTLGFLARSAKDSAARSTLERYLDDDCVLISASAAIGIARIDRDAASPAVRSTLAHAVASGLTLATGRWSWNDGEVAAAAREMRSAIFTTDELLAEVHAARAANDLTTARDYAERVFAQLFMDNEHGPTRLWLPSELDDRRRTLLRVLAELTPPDDSGVPHLPIDIGLADVTGMPTAIAAVRRFLGDDTGASERILVAELPAWAAVYEAVLATPGRVDAARVRGAFAELAPADTIDIVRDLLAGPHRPWQRRRLMEFTAEGYAADNNHTSRAILLLADVLHDAALVGNTLARSLADEELAKSRRDGMRSTLAALVLLRADAAIDVDRLIAIDLAPATTYRLALRAVYSLIAPERRVALLGAQSLYRYHAYRDPRGEVRRWVNDRGWDVIDLFPPTEIVARITAAQREWERHRAAGDDAHAEPVGGSTTSTQQIQAEPDEDFPHERAAELLALAQSAE